MQGVLTTTVAQGESDHLKLRMQAGTMPWDGLLLSNPHLPFLLLVCERKPLGSGAPVCYGKPHRYLPGFRGVWGHVRSCRGRRPLPGRWLLYCFPRAVAESKMGWVLQEGCALPQQARWGLRSELSGCPGLCCYLSLIAPYVTGQPLSCVPWQGHSENPVSVGQLRLCPWSSRGRELC